MRGILYILILFTGANCFAQNDLLRTAKLDLNENPQKVDSLSIIPSSLQVTFIYEDSIKEICEECFILDAVNATIRLRDIPSEAYEAYADFRVFPFKLNEQSNYIKEGDVDSLDIYVLKPWFDKVTEDPFSGGKFGNLQYSGSFSRGISFGNSQDLSVNSGFNLQLSGTLGGDVEVLAAITDNNIPFQPAGNTQQIQEFDKIFIQLKRSVHQIRLGDFDLRKPKMYFANYQKKLQGIQYSHDPVEIAGGQLSSRAALAVAKGKYARNSFQGQEGNQGPYKLLGNQGETFLIVLAASERVYIDGVLLSRGELNDYVIDYNSGEVTFTNKRLITKDHRILVEFEYSDKNYLRTTVEAGMNYTQGRWSMAWQIFNEQDSKNQPIADSLSDARIALMSSVGDSIDRALFSGVDSGEFDPDLIMYKRIDSLGFSNVFVKSGNPDSAKYFVSFSEVGFGAGDYVLSQSLANGRVYKWVQPQGGVPQGNYAPIVPLVTPKRTQLSSLQLGFATSDKGLIQTELAISNNDLNTFSTIDDQDDAAIALRSTFQERLSFGDSSQWTLQPRAFHEFRAKNFDGPERLRSVEFERDWNLAGEELRSQEHFAGVGFTLSNQKTLNTAYAFNTLLREQLLKAYQHEARLTLNTAFRTTIKGSGSFTQTDGQTDKSDFLRAQADLFQAFNKKRSFGAGLRYTGENKKVVIKGQDSLSANSFRFDEYGVYLSLKDSNKHRVNAEYKRRDDYLPENLEVNQLSSYSDQYSFNGLLQLKKTQRVDWDINFRQAFLKNELADFELEENLLGRLAYTFSVSKGFIQASTQYSVGGGREAKREYAYQEVPAGQGNYAWRDYNMNGLKELDEFEQAQFDDEAIFIRVLLPTNSYVSTDENVFNYQLNINPKVFLKTADKRPLWSRFSALSSFQNRRKFSGVDNADAYNPFGQIADSHLLSQQRSIRNIIYYDRSNATFWAELSQLETIDKVLLLNGTDARNREQFELKGTYNFNSNWELQALSGYEFKRLNSEAFSTRDYQIEGPKVGLTIGYQQQSNYRVRVISLFSELLNAESLGGERSIKKELSTEARYNLVGKSAVQANFSLVNYRYNGAANNTLAYTMLDGLRAGSNYLWRLSLDHSFVNNLQMRLSYDGRKSEKSRTIHLGSASLTAIF